MKLKATIRNMRQVQFHSFPYYVHLDIYFFLEDIVVPVEVSSPDGNFGGKNILVTLRILESKF
jgi:hypothetical protein